MEHKKKEHNFRQNLKNEQKVWNVNIFHMVTYLIFLNLCELDHKKKQHFLEKPQYGQNVSNVNIWSSPITN
jgi:hypothetical protein